MSGPEPAASQTTALPSVRLWFGATFGLCFTWAFLFSTWVSRGAEVKAALGLGTAEFGLLAMLYPLGGLVGVIFSSRIVRRFGSRSTAFGCFVAAAASLTAVGLAVDGGHVSLAAVALFGLGPPLSTADYIANYEGSRVDNAAGRSLLPAIHGAFGLGMLSAAGLAGLLSDASVSLQAHFALIGLSGLAVGVAATYFLPIHIPVPRRANVSPEGPVPTSPWRERRTVTVALIAFAFVLAELGMATWIPVALTESGFSPAKAAFALSLFWIVLTIVRLCGGFLLDRLGRRRVGLGCALVTAAGLTVFALTEVIDQPYLGIALAAGGMAVGFTVSVSAMGDEPHRAPERITMLITTVYTANVSVGPLLGAVGEAVGIYWAFVVPAILLVVAAAATRVLADPRTD